MFSWLRTDPDEDTSEERNNIKASDREWQANLDSKGLKPQERAREMGKNYKALTNCNTQQLREITNVEYKDSPRDVFNNEALKETRDLLDNQTEATSISDNKDVVIEILEEEREKKRGWFW